MLYVDALASFWREWVINYDVGHQYNLGQAATRNSLELLQRARGWARRHHEALLNAARRTSRTVSDSPVKWSLGAAVMALLLLLAANAGKLWRVFRTRQLAARPEKSPSLAATIWYERMTRMLARKGWNKAPAHTPKEFLICIPDEATRKSVAEVYPALRIRPLRWLRQKMRSVCRNYTKKFRLQDGARPGQREFVASHQRRTATTDQIASTTPKGQAPWRNP